MGRSGRSKYLCIRSACMNCRYLDLSMPVSISSFVDETYRPFATELFILDDKVLDLSKLTVAADKSFNPLPPMPILSPSNSTAKKNMMSKIWTNGDNLSDSVENIVRKEEIARYEQFLLFSQCF